MPFVRTSSPHFKKPLKSGDLMLQVILATLPGLGMLSYHFGWGPLLNVLLCAVLALVLEAAVLRVRGRPVLFYLRDNSALLTAVLLGLALPPYLPWWTTAVGIFFAIVIAKQLYGGLGYNPFNPAMVGYALLLVSFPVQMTRWAAPELVQATPDLATALGIIFGGELLPDAATMATPLEAFRHKGALTSDEFWASATQLVTAMPAWQQVNLAFLVGGIYLIVRRVITWHIPVAMLASIAVISFVAYGADASNYASLWFHLTSGATMLGAFFIATDPVTAATSNKGKLVYGAMIGLLVWLIRNFGNYPDAVAFAVLLMNLSAPFLDYYTRPRSYGHKNPDRGIKP